MSECPQCWRKKKGASLFFNHNKKSATGWPGFIILITTASLLPEAPSPTSSPLLPHTKFNKAVLYVVFKPLYT